MARPRTPAVQRFWQKVAPIKRATDCWIWVGPLVGGTGYGKISIGYDSFRAHRFAWSLVHGAIPNGLEILHRCDNPSCVNLAHLEVGTHAANIADKVQKGRQAKGERVNTAKLGEVTVRAIRTATGRNVDIAMRFGVDRLHVGLIRRGVIWKHVT